MPRAGKDGTAGHRVSRNVAVLLAFIALAALWTWPLAASFSSRLPHDPIDPVLNTWILWWNSRSVPLTDAWWDAPFLVPMRGTLALSENLLGISAFTTPIQLAGATPLAAYNAALLLSFALSGFFTYLLGRRLTGSALSGWCAGIGFACAPYRAGQLGHLQVLTAQWMPLMLLGLHECLAGARRHRSGNELPGSAPASTDAASSAGHPRPVSSSRRGLVLFACAWLLQALSNGYYMLFLPVLIGSWLAWFVVWRRDSRRGMAIVAVWIVASLPLVPILLKYREVHAGLGLARSLGDIRQFSATFASFTQAPPLLAMWPEPQGTNQEQFLFPGVTGIALILLTLVIPGARRAPSLPVADRSLLFYALATVLLWLLAMGPGGEPGGPSAPWRPYSWLLGLPGFDSLRVPARFAMPATLTLALAAALAAARLAPRRRSWRAVFGAVVIAGLTLDGLIGRMPIELAPSRVLVPGAPDAMVIEIPTDDAAVNAAAMYRQMYHRRPLVNGYTGHVAYHFAALSLALARGDTSVLTSLARQHPLVIIVNSRSDPGGGYRQMIEQMPGIQPDHVSAVGPVFLLPQQPGRPQVPEGNTLAAEVTEAGDGRLRIDLGEVRSVSTIQFNLRLRHVELDGRLLVEASDDGGRWSDAWLGWTGEYVFEAVLRDPQLAPVRIPVGGVRARYLRIHPAPPWLKEELRVSGF
jgi:hypothetical protein